MILYKDLQETALNLNSHMAKQRKNALGFEESVARLEEIIRLTEAPSPSWKT